MISVLFFRDVFSWVNIINISPQTEIASTRYLGLDRGLLDDSPLYVEVVNQVFQTRNSVESMQMRHYTYDMI